MCVVYIHTCIHFAGPETAYAARWFNTVSIIDGWTEVMLVLLCFYVILMCMFVYVCMTFVFVCICIYVYVYMYIYICIYVCMYLCACVRMFACVHACTPLLSVMHDIIGTCHVCYVHRRHILCCPSVSSWLVDWPYKPDALTYFCIVTYAQATDGNPTLESQCVDGTFRIQNERINEGVIPVCMHSTNVFVSDPSQRHLADACMFLDLCNTYRCSMHSHFYLHAYIISLCVYVGVYAPIQN
jgi:hypothetical protein